MKYKKDKDGIRKYRQGFLQSPFSHIWNLGRLVVYKNTLYEKRFHKMMRKYKKDKIIDETSLAREDKESGDLYIVARNVINSKRKNHDDDDYIHEPKLQQTSLQNYFN